MITTWYNEKNERYERPQRRLVDTTVGRALSTASCPDEMRLYDDSLDKGGLQKLVGRCYQVIGPERTTDVVDEIKG